VSKLSGKRLSIEETFRDQKDLHFGMGLSATHIRDAVRRDRLLLLAAIAHAPLTLLGAASEEAGLDKYLKANTVKRRTHAPYRRGLYWYDCIPTMREDWLRPLMVAFDRIVREQAVLHEVLGIIRGDASGRHLHRKGGVNYLSGMKSAGTVRPSRERAESRSPAPMIFCDPRNRASIP
jgi:hypothetical protein